MAGVVSFGLWCLCVLARSFGVLLVYAENKVNGDGSNFRGSALYLNGVDIDGEDSRTIVSQ